MSRKTTRPIRKKPKGSGVAIDTNILLLLFVGLAEESLITRFKRTRQFSQSDFQLLARWCARFSSLRTTPNVLTETINLGSELSEPGRSKFFARISAALGDFLEIYVPSKELSRHRRFAQLGLTDSALLHLANEGVLILTDDWKLAGVLEHHRLNVVNFNHLREQSWRGEIL